MKVIREIATDNPMTIKKFGDGSKEVVGRTWFSNNRQTAKHSAELLIIATRIRRIIALCQVRDISGS